MKRAVCMLRHTLTYRRDMFIAGLKAIGYSVHDRVSDPRPTDLLVIWNRYGGQDATATRFEQVGAKVLVCENGYLGKAWLGDTWIAVAHSHHSGAGTWPVGNPDRWDSLQVPMEPFRTTGKEVVILEQRGIGEGKIASPPKWAEQMRGKLGGRIRKHPANGNVKALEEDLVDASAVVTWNSGAALRALLLGVPVWYAHKNWIGASAATHVDLFGKVDPCRDEQLRLQMFRRLIWSNWRLTSIETGAAFTWLLQPQEALAA